MEVDKPGAKGGFFQLFDWNAKSRKKLFSSKSEIPESSDQGKENLHGSAILQFQQEHKNGFAPNARGHNDFHYASLASCDSEYGTRAPGVVARLMGLDSLPISNVNEPCSDIESHSFRDSNYLRTTPAFQNEHDIVIFESVRNKLDGLTRNPLNLRLQKVQSRPIKRFQKEVLPPKSAKLVSLTHHRLLSPIKSPGFIPPKNAADIIETAAKLIEQSPRSTIKIKLTTLGSSSVPFKLQDLKEKADSTRNSLRPGDVSQEGKEYNSVKPTKKQLNARGQDPPDNSYLYKRYEESNGVGSQSLKNKEKSVNIHKRDELPSVGNISSEKQKERSDVKPSCVSRNQRNMQNKAENKTSSRRPSEVLTPNYQKQNCASAGAGENYEPSVSHPKDRKDSNLSTGYVYQRPKRAVNKIVVDNVVPSRKTNTTATELGKAVSSSRIKTSSKKKVPINGNIQSDGSVAQKVLVMKDEKSVKCNGAIEAKWDTSDEKNSLDVVSFTFTSPIKKSESGSNSCGGDALSVLLEQRLKELTSRVEPSQQDLSEAFSFFSSVNIYGNMGSIVKLAESLPVNDDICKGKQKFQNDYNCPSVEIFCLKAEKENQGLEDIEEHKKNSDIECQSYLRLPGASSFSSQRSISGANCDSFDVDRSSSSMQCLSIESYGGVHRSSTRKCHPAGGDVEISDTASSLSVKAISETVRYSLYTTELKNSSYWELQYIVDILGNAELMFEDFALGKAHKIIAPCLFDQLENKKIESNKVTEERFMLERRVLFDCVNECLEVKCRPLLAGTFQVWAKQTTILHWRQCLAEEFYREISNLTNIEELMVDELVGRDMNSKNGKWVDFEIEVFEEGMEIEKRIVASLINELINDFLF